MADRFENMTLPQLRDEAVRLNAEYWDAYGRKRDREKAALQTAPKLIEVCRELDAKLALLDLEEKKPKA